MGGWVDVNMYVHTCVCVCVCLCVCVYLLSQMSAHKTIVNACIDG